MDALTAFLAGGFSVWIAHAIAEGKPIPTEEAMLQALREAKPQLIQTIRIDTTEAHDNVPYSVAGQSIYITNPETPSLPVYIRLNEPEAEQIELTAQRNVKIPFYRFYITNVVGTGTLVIVVSKTPVVDFTEAFTTINMAAASIMLPVDIQAQYVTLDIDITAQTIGNLSIDIAAQTVGNLDINIAASAITMNVAVTGTAQINITAQSVGVYLMPDWAAKEGTDKNFYAAAMDIDPGAVYYGLYPVPAGKKLYINALSFFIHADLDADRDKPQIGHADLADWTDYPTVQVLAGIGGNGGGSIPFTKPIAIAAGRELRYAVYNYTNHTCTIGVSAFGYEV